MYQTNPYDVRLVTCSPIFIQSEPESLVSLSLPPILDHLG